MQKQKPGSKKPQQWLQQPVEVHFQVRERGRRTVQNFSCGKLALCFNQQRVVQLRTFPIK